MSINLNISIPIDAAIAIRDIDYDLERIDGDVEITLAAITTEVIQAIKGLSDEYFLDELEELSPESTPTGSRSSSATTQHSASSTSSTDSRLKVSFYENFFHINVIDPKGNQHRVETCSNMTISELQTKIDEQCPIESKNNQKRLVWRGYRLNQPDTTLGQYGIGPDCTLVLLHHLLPSLPDELNAAPLNADAGEFDFWISTPSGTFLPVKARPQTTTAELATAIWNQLRILPSMQRLVHQGMVVYDGSSYAAGRDHLIFTLNEVSIGPDAVISVQIADGV